MCIFAPIFAVFHFISICVYLSMRFIVLKYTLYNQGFEIKLNNHIWFAFFENGDAGYDENGQPVDGCEYSCDRTMKGWVHDTLSNQWACFIGTRQKPNNMVSKVEEKTFIPHESQDSQVAYYKEIEKLGLFKSSGKKVHPSMNNQIKKRPFPISKPTIAEIKYQIKLARNSVKTDHYLPDNFDWRNVNGQNFVSPVKNQKSCGSCYAFASTGMFEARARVQTNNNWQPNFSEQDIVSCSQYSQGCSGGFPFLISKYGKDFGLVDSNCVPYTAKDDACTTNTTCKRYLIDSYGYVGGYYGNADERAMREEIYKNGPIAVSIDANGLHDYESGIWIQGQQLGFDPFEYTNHVVVIVGWGVDETSGLPFWTIRNSWGEDFGMNGYFNMIRGISNAGVESLPAWAKMIPPL